MAEIWLMRHAAYAGHRNGYHAPADAPLTEEGREQIRRALPLPEGITDITTSPLLRAQRTGALISDLTGLPVVAVSELLTEWRAPSAMVGRDPRAYPPTYDVWRRRRLGEPSLPYGDGESLTHLHTRAQRALGFLHRLNSDQEGDLLVVSHKILLEVLTHLNEGPAAFAAATTSTWSFLEIRRLDCDQG